jgi:hypothetical protein
MRKSPLFSEVVPISGRRAVFGRRPILPSYTGVTALVLVRHHQTDKAILVSDTGIRASAVWIPKAMVTIELPSDRGILVATISKTFADQKGLCAHRIIDPSLFNEATAEVLREANARAARKRNFYRGHRQPDGRHINQNAFA